MSNIDKLAAVPVRAKREFELVDGVMVPFEEVDRNFFAKTVPARFPKIAAKFESDGNIFELADDVLMPFAAAVIANAIAGVDGPVTATIQAKVEKMVEDRIPHLARLRIMSEVLEASMVGGFRKGTTAKPTNRRGRRAEAAKGQAPAKPRSAKRGSTGKQAQPISA